MYKHILIATDGSELAQKAVTHGLALAKSVGAVTTIVTATKMWSALAMTQQAHHSELHPIEDYEMKAREWTNKILDMCKKQGEAALTIHHIFLSFFVDRGNRGVIQRVRLAQATRSASRPARRFAPIRTWLVSIPATHPTASTATGVQAGRPAPAVRKYRGCASPASLQSTAGGLSGGHPTEKSVAWPLG